MFKFSCDKSHPKVEWFYETTFSMCPTCRVQCAGSLASLSERTSFKPAPMQRLILPCSSEDIDMAVVQEPPPHVEPNRIVSVEFMDGQDEAAGRLEQFINLKVDEKWVDGSRIHNTDRLGARPRVKVRFQRPGAENFTLELVRDSSLLTYTLEEEEREHYNQSPRPSERIVRLTDSNGEVVLEDAIALAAAGGHVYRLLARDAHGSMVSSRSSLCVWRRIFIQPVVMKSAMSSYNAWSTAGAGALKAQFAGMHFDVVVLEGRSIVDLDNIACSEERDSFYQSIEEKCDTQEVSRFRPWLVTLAFILHFAEETEGTQRGVPIEAHNPNSLFTTRFMLESHHVGHGTYAWAGLGGRQWLASLPTLYTADGKTKVLGLPAECVKLEAPNVHFSKRMSRVVLDSSTLNEAQRSALGQGGMLKFKFRHPSFRGGIAIVGTSDLIAVATQMTWQETPLVNLCGFIIHELGHKLGMVPSGTENSLCDLSATATSYEDRGHTGPHCHSGLEKRDSFLGVGGATCVMFGAPSTTTAFCDACAVALHKLHMGTGWIPCWER